MFFVILAVLLCANFSIIHAAQKSIVYSENKAIYNQLVCNIICSEDEYFINLFNNTDIADINAVDDTGDTLLTLASKYKRLKIIAFLLDNYADLNILNDDGTVLVQAIRNCNPALVESLVSAGADPLMKQKYKFTWKTTIGAFAHVYIEKNACFFIDHFAGDAYYFFYDNQHRFGCINKVAFRSCDKMLYIDAITRGLAEYKKRKDFYKAYIVREITKKLAGVQDLANICIEYDSMDPGMTLPENIKLKAEQNEHNAERPW